MDKKKRIKGAVKWFSSEKGFGFIQSSEGKDIFVYYTDILSDGFKTLKKGQVVEFEIIEGERGPQASGVKIL
ncbi:MAG: cold-shock protein [Actinobacteria bacterium]|nr:cold-shock protein [Actinomycetota bacterium]